MLTRDRFGGVSGTTDYSITQAAHSPFRDAIDRLVALILLIVLSPFLLMIVLCLKKDGGSAFYAQERVGMHGRKFLCWKLRTMVFDADDILKDHLRDNPEAQKEWNLYFKLKHDPRVTRLGYFLRKSSLDELPQLWNVLKGDMSLVGPRPVTQKERRYYGAYWSHYLSVKPGITGLWQINGRSNTSYDQRVKFDHYYVQNHTLRMDVMILLRTIFVVFKKAGAY